MKPRPISPTGEEDAVIQRGIDADSDNPEWTAADFKRARPTLEVIAETLGADAAEAMRQRGRPKSADTKAQVTLRLDRDVVARFRAGGRGWQSRINAELRKALGI